MKKSVFLLLILATFVTEAKKTPPLDFVSGHELTLINKLMDTPRRYARVDTAKYDGFTGYQRNTLLQQPADGSMRETTHRARKTTRYSNSSRT